MWQFDKKKYAVVDIETTGGNFQKGGKIIEVAIILFDGNKITDKFTSLVNPNCRIPPFITKLTGISDTMVKKAPLFNEIAEKINAFTTNSIFVAHNTVFDYSFLKAEMNNVNKQFYRDTLCTLQLSRNLLRNEPSYSLGRLCNSIGIELKNRHRAEGDALATVELLIILLNKNLSAVLKSVKKT
tara:strand:- start:315 stop:866 length:552 start_codon:yes stop_codon:yes gene_type:complete